jgi:AcrR family transcriptional regulator
MSSPTHWKAKPHRPEYDRMRERLVAAGWELACEHGVKRLTLNRVATAAACARSSVYRYFDNKQQLVTAILQDQILRLGVALDEQLSQIDDPREQLVTGLYLAVSTLKSGPSLQLFRQLSDSEGLELADLLQSSLPDIASDLFRIDPVFAQARHDGLLRDDLTDQDIMRWLTMVGTALLQQSSFGSEPEQELAYLSKMIVPAVFKSH